MEAQASHVHAHSKSSHTSPVSSLTAIDVFTSEATSPSRQQRLLQNRNARFPAKKLSISGLSNKLTQLIGNNDPAEDAARPARNQENKLHKSKSTGTIGKKSSLSILEEISNTTRSRAAKRQRDISIYQDHPERPLLETSPLAASSPYARPESDVTSPIGFDHIKDSLNTMRLREVSLNQSWSPMVRSPPSLKARPRKGPGHAHFDADEYIEHIEKELQHVRDEAYSPLTRRPMKEKLRAANKENERLQKELAQLKEKFETEVKRTVEHKTMVEVELKRKVRDLEESLEEKENAMREIQYQHEERRLDGNIIDSLKANIDRLEQDKLDMEEINLSMSKRNEVLTQLLAMSPTKSMNGFNLGSPVRERRNPRPMSLILPRLPTSPKQLSQKGSVACSPHPVSSAEISPFKLSPDQQRKGEWQAEPRKLEHMSQQPDLDQVNQALRSPDLQESFSRRWTMISDISAASAFGTEDLKPSRRKARKFVSGSTQLKPLLLPTMAGESMPSTSTASSPRTWPSRWEHNADIDETALPTDDLGEIENMIQPMYHDTLSVLSTPSGEYPGPAYSTSEPNGQEHFLAPSEFHHGSPAESAPPRRFNECGLEKSEIVITQWPGQSSPDERLHHDRDLMPTMPMPTTPDSLATVPEPLFSPARREAAVALPDWMQSHSPTTLLESTILLRKRRQPSYNLSGTESPLPKVPRFQAKHTSAHHLSSRPPLLQQVPPTSATRAPQRQLQVACPSDNFVEILRQKNFAVKPLAALTIRTVFKILSTCTSALREFRQDPFALARRVLASAWYTNWDLLGKLSWWVLGLFVHPQEPPKARAPIKWDQYDGESIASRYCDSSDDGRDAAASHSRECDSATPGHQQIDSSSRTLLLHRQAKPGWGRSLLLWGKFSAAMMLAVGGAVVKGPGEMLKDVRRRSQTGLPRHKHCKSCGAGQYELPRTRVHPIDKGEHTFLPNSAAKESNIFEDYSGEFEFRSDAQLDSSSFLDQIQQPDYEQSTLRPGAARRQGVDSTFSPFPTPPINQSPKYSSTHHIQDERLVRP